MKMEIIKIRTEISEIGKKESSGQDGGIGRDPSLPRTTKRRITTNLKSINNQSTRKANCMELQPPRN